MSTLSGVTFTSKTKTCVMFFEPLFSLVDGAQSADLSLFWDS